MVVEGRAGDQTTGMTINAQGLAMLDEAPASAYVRSSSGKGVEPIAASAPLVPTDLAPYFAALVRYEPPPPPPPSETPPTLAPPPTLLPPRLWFGRLEIASGCLELDIEGRERRAFMIPADAILFRDDEGYLTLGNPDNPANHNIRVGEPGYWFGEGVTLDGEEVPTPLREQCGATRATMAPIRSAAAAAAAADEAAAIRLSKDYGVPIAAAERYVARCRLGLSVGPEDMTIRMIETPCGQTPPPPARSAADCPAGSRPVANACRTPEGYLRPLPQGLDTAD